MAREIEAIDITNTPDLLRLAEEVARSGVSRVLRSDDRDVAVIIPVPLSPEAGRLGKPTSPDDPLWSIIGIADPADFPNVPADVSVNKHRYLADAYADSHDEER